MFHGISAFRLFWQRLLARLRYCGGAHYLAGAPSLPPPLTPEQEKALLARMAEGDACARDDLITHNLRLVVYLAKKYENSGVPAEDMISIGTIGLIKAVNTFTPERSIKLATYASRCIGNEILMYLRKTSNRRQEASLDEPLNVDGAADHGAALRPCRRRGAHPEGSRRRPWHQPELYLPAGKADHPYIKGPAGKRMKWKNANCRPPGLTIRADSHIIKLQKALALQTASSLPD